MPESVFGGQTGGGIAGPETSTNKAIARWSGTDGTALLDSDPTVEDDGRIANVTDPTGDQDAATKAYVDNTIEDAAGIAGPETSTNKAIARWSGNDGDTLQDSDPTIEDDGRIANVTDPTGDQDAATKAYVDTAIEGVSGAPAQSDIKDTDLISDALNDNFVTAASLDAKWTWFNQGSATATFVRKRLRLFSPGGGTLNLRGITQPVPSGNWRIRAEFGRDSVDVTTIDTGFVLRESGTEKLITFGNTYSGGHLVRLTKWTNPTTISANYTLQNPATGSDLNAYSGNPAWWEIEYDGTNYIWRSSRDGVYFRQFDSRAKANFFTTAADQIGLFVSTDNAQDAILIARSFYRVG